ncbi:Hydroxyacylglutathione hydrolase GloC [Pseudoalteromonas holothuriae]|uniref:Hydroxyacylglutathione hydrolase GloC n=1 Tax=Pseudoalteromonas holothuriae TaxID=2963714 RepID=A0A9W4QY60_9GAMM|nr:MULTISPECIES: MBL fold metallo-hydrolase [unclassified Pseudoalteromonas]CAH9055375.1 Hydroxyacylglutathione hydrolase GloC [Pseudoalteromonas sp. CIP111951]CAH9058074.1 Hydroxyacylglutathione hydrolase GloC [Pseudoalteromonas sp. CIP111854]
MHVITVPVTPFMQNARFITCNSTGKSAVVDPGGDTDKLLTIIKQQQLDIVCILLTHGHLDHVGAADELKAILNVEIIGPHIDEKFWFDALPMQSQMFGFATKSTFYPDRWVTDQEQFRVGELELEVRHCPGHTPGHVVFYHKPSSQVLVGDVLFKGSVGRTDFPKGDAAQLKQSILEQLFTLPGDTLVLSGHGENTTIGYEKQHNPFMSGRFG